MASKTTKLGLSVVGETPADDVLAQPQANTTGAATGAATGTEFINPLSRDADGDIDFQCIFSFDDADDLKSKLNARLADCGGGRIIRTSTTGGVDNAVPPITFVEISQPFVADFTGLPELGRKSETKLSPLEWLFQLTCCATAAEWLKVWTVNATKPFHSGHPDMGSNGSPQWGSVRNTVCKKLVMAKLALVIPVRAGCFHAAGSSGSGISVANTATVADMKAKAKAKLLAAREAAEAAVKAAKAAGK